MYSRCSPHDFIQVLTRNVPRHASLYALDLVRPCADGVSVMVARWVVWLVGAFADEDVFFGRVLAVLGQPGAIESLEAIILCSEHAAEHEAVRRYVFSIEAPT